MYYKLVFSTTDLKNGKNFLRRITGLTVILEVIVRWHLHQTI